jgi:hypothetical protein
MNTYGLPDHLIQPPAYEAVAFEDIEEDKFYYVRMTKANGSLVDMVLFTDPSPRWKNAEEVRPKLVASRGFKRVVDEAILAEAGVSVADEHANKVVARDEFLSYFEDPDDPEFEEAFFKLPYAKDAENKLIPEDWFEHQVYLTFPVGKEYIKMEFDPTEYGYVFYKEAASAITANVGQRRGTRRPRRKQRKTRRRLNRRRYSSQ